MKKITTILLLITTSAMLSIGCSSLKDSSNLYLGNCPDEMSTMGKKYFVNNLKKGNYEVEFTAKEYEHGTFKKEHKLYKSDIEHNGKNNTLKIGVSDDNEIDSFYIKSIINDTESLGYDLESFKDSYNKGIALSILDEDKYFDLDSEVPIAAYSIGGEDSSTQSLNIDEEFEISNNNFKDLVVYINISK